MYICCFDIFQMLADASHIQSLCCGNIALLELGLKVAQKEKTTMEKRLQHMPLFGNCP